MKKKSGLDNFLNNSKTSKTKKPLKNLKNASKPRFYHLREFLKKKYINPNYIKFRKFRKDGLPLIGFITFATFMTYLMHTNLDEIKREAETKKSIKQEMIEKENQALTELLLKPKNQNFNVKIQDIQNNKKYKFEKYDDEEEDYTITQNHFGRKK